MRCLSCRNRLLSSAELRLFHHMSRQRFSQTAVRFCRHWHISRSPPQAQPSSCMVATFTLTRGAGSLQCSPEEVRKPHEVNLSSRSSSPLPKVCHFPGEWSQLRGGSTLGSPVYSSVGGPLGACHCAIHPRQRTRACFQIIRILWLVLCMLLRRALLCLGESGRGVAAPCQGLCEQSNQKKAM